MKILCIGEMLIDFTPVKGMADTYTANPGGAPANVAVSVARNGVGAGFMGKLGNDDFGKLLLDTLKNDEVEMLAPELTDEDVPAMKADAVDTTGAGDAYWGAFLASMLRQGVRRVSDITMDKLVMAGRYGSVSGGLCI